MTKRPFATKDLNEAAYMYVTDNMNMPRLPDDWDGIERDGHSVWFYFTDVTGREGQRKDYNSTTAMVNVRHFITARNRLLDIINATR